MRTNSTASRLNSSQNRRRVRLLFPLLLLSLRSMVDILPSQVSGPSGPFGEVQRPPSRCGRSASLAANRPANIATSIKELPLLDRAILVDDLDLFAQERAHFCVERFGGLGVDGMTRVRDQDETGCRDGRSQRLGHRHGHPLILFPVQQQGGN